MKYDFRKIEKKHQAAWEKAGIYHASDKSKNRKWYSLIEFPYPSGAGLHMGHLRSNTAMDIISRKRRMEGYNVLYPIGWDAFGLPTENYAIKTGIAPQKATKQNTDIFRKQLKSLGFSFDWSREIDTTDPNYYKWTQWMFLKFFEHGLAYKAETQINWCPKDKIGLANEEAAGGVCDRCGGPVEKRIKKQWMLKITDYAEKLLEGLKEVDYLPEIKTQQINWIGRSEGAEISFNVVNVGNVGNVGGVGNEQLKQAQRSNKRSDPIVITSVDVFTTRPDTLFGATYLVLAPEHELLANRKSQIANRAEVYNYIAQAQKKTETERAAEDKVKTGVELKGVRAINPATKEEIPIFVADYVLGGYGTGAIMAVPAHDQRDFEFAKKYNLPVRMVICPNYPAPICPVLDKAYEGEGYLVDSGKFSGLKANEAMDAITKFVGGKKTVKYKLRDWVFSRQRYWGEPIPLVFCAHCAQKPKEISNSQFLISNKKFNSKFQIPNSKFSIGEQLNPGWIPVPEKDLPVKLPSVKNYQPREDGESPLASVAKWVNVKCPHCGGPAQRETDTMPNWAGSSWYFLRYIDPKNKKEFASMEKLRYWLGLLQGDAAVSIRSPKGEGGVDWYNGGMEHVTLHLLYSRFWNRFLHDLGLVPVAEPYKKRTAHGLILAEGGVKMSKSKGNVVNPDPLVKEFGADAVRLYTMFMGPFDQAIVWDNRGILGMSRFLERTWRLLTDPKQRIYPNNTNKSVRGIRVNSDFLDRLLHKTIKKVTEDIEAMRFNTAISALMIFLNEAEKANLPPSSVSRLNFLKLLAPFAPHISEELWQQLNAKRSTLNAFQSVHMESWPEHDPKLIKEEKITLVIQVNGKTRGTIEVPADISEAEAQKLVLASDVAKKYLNGQKPKRVIYVPGRILNFIID